MKIAGNFRRGGLGRIGVALALLAACVLLSMVTGAMAQAEDTAEVRR